VKKPRNWSDSERIETLGHEILHAMGHYHSKKLGYKEPLVGGNFLDY
jgi:hypothetical protein